MTEKNNFPLIFPKKHCLITQNQFSPFLGILSRFLGVPRTLNFGGLNLYFDNSLREKWSEVERPPRDGLSRKNKMFWVKNPSFALFHSPTFYFFFHFMVEVWLICLNLNFLVY